MKTNKAFTFMCELDDTDNNRFNGQQFTTSTNWTRHVLTFAGDTTGTLDNDNARSLMLSFWFHAGSNFTSGTYSANTWQSRASTDVNRAVGIGSFFDSTDNEIRLTGLQMEVGENASDFEHRSFGEELLLCQRYLVNFADTSSGTNAVFCGRGNGTTQVANTAIPLPVVMRAAPTFSEIASLRAIGPSTYSLASNVTPAVTGTPTFETTIAASFSGFSGLTDNRLAGVYIFQPFSISAEL